MAGKQFDNPSYGLSLTNTDNYCDSFCKLCSLVDPLKCPPKQLAIIRSTKCELSRAVEQKVLKWFSLTFKPDMACVRVYEYSEMNDNEKASNAHSAQCQVIIMTRESVKEAYQSRLDQIRICPINRVLRHGALVLLLDLKRKQVSENFESIFPQFVTWKSVNFHYEGDEVCRGLVDHICQSFHVSLRNISFRVVPKILYPTQNEFVVFFDQPLQIGDLVDIILTKESKRVVFILNVKMTNPAAVIVNLPEDVVQETQNLNLKVTLNNHDIGNAFLMCVGHEMDELIGRLGLNAQLRTKHGLVGATSKELLSKARPFRKTIRRLLKGVYEALLPPIPEYDYQDTQQNDD